MQPDVSDLDRLWDMLDVSRELRGFVSGQTFDQFLDDTIRQRAVERSLEILGEAARQVSPAFQASHPAIPWRQVIGQRNYIAHGYGDIDNEVLWRSVQEDVPALIGLLEALLDGTERPGSI